MSGRPRTSSVLARLGAAALALVVLAGCGSSSSDKASSSAGAVSDGPTLTGAGPGKPCHAAAAPSSPGEPAVEMPKVAPSELVSTDLKAGDGPEANVGDQITVQYVGVACSSGTQFDASWDRGEPITFGLQPGQLIDGWIKGIPGMKVGGRRQLVIPPDLAYGSNPPSKAIRPGETLVFVIDLVSVAAGTGGDATGSQARGAGPGQPCKAAAAPTAAGQPTVEMPDVAPDKLVSTDLKVGDGAEAELGDEVTVQYVGIACSTGKVFDATWTRGAQPVSFGLEKGKLIDGWTEGIPGMKVGGRRQLVIPPDLGYGERSPSSDIPAGETLVFVVDLVSVGSPPTS